MLQAADRITRVFGKLQDKNHLHSVLVELHHNAGGLDHLGTHEITMLSERPSNRLEADCKLSIDFSLASDRGCHCPQPQYLEVLRLKTSDMQAPAFDCVGLSNTSLDPYHSGSEEVTAASVLFANMLCTKGF